MKRIAVILLALLLCGSLVSCAEAQNAQDAFVASPEGAMIGKTFRETPTWPSTSMRRKLRPTGPPS